MKAFAVVLLPKNNTEYWFREGRNEICGYYDVEEDKPVAMFFNLEEEANLYIEHILKINPGRVYLKMKTMEVCNITLGPINKAIFSDNSLLPN